MSASSSSLWEAFRADPSVQDLYLPDSHIVFLPTGSGAASDKSISAFFSSGAYSHPKRLSVEERVIHRTVGDSSAVDEVELTVKFVSGAGGWILPGISPHHLEDITVTFPLVISGSFTEGRIASVRYLWDNASVLKMVKLIGSRHSWPIVAETQIEALRDPSRFRLNPFGGSSVSAGSRPQSSISNIFTSPPVSPPPAQFKKGHPALTSTVFSNLKNNNVDHGADQQRDKRNRSPPSPTISEASTRSRSSASSPPTSPISGKKGHPALTSTLFDRVKSSPQGNSNGNNGDSSVLPAPVAKKGHPSLTSTLFDHLKSPDPQPQPSRKSPQLDQQKESRYDEEERPAGWRPDYVKPKGHPALTSTIFSKTAAPAPASVRQQPQEDIEERGAGWRADYVKPKGHPALTSTIFSQVPEPPRIVRPYKKTSHNIFGVPQEDAAKTQKDQLPISPPEQPSSPVSSTSKPYVLQPSAIEAELERNEQQQQELKESLADVQRNARAVEELEQHMREQEELNAKIEAEVEAAAQEKEMKAREELSKLDLKKTSPSPPVAAAGAPMSPLSPQSPPTRRIHPNYRSSFTIG